MPELKPIKGHTSCYGILNYLLKENRALSTDSLNLDGIPVKAWWRAMDSTREVAGNNKQLGRSRVRTYQQYIISPDPKDNISLELLREITMEWATKHFPDYEIGVVYHNDNEQGILHSHLVINNTNLRTGKRVSSYLTNRKAKELNIDLQQIAKAHGLSGFDNENYSRPKQEEGFSSFSYAKDEREPREHAHPRTKQKAYRTKQEREILAKGGYSWLEDIRDRIDAARAVSNCESEFLRACALLDLHVETSSKGDYLFVHPDKETRKATGSRLGSSYSKPAIAREHLSAARRNAANPNARLTPSSLYALNGFRDKESRVIGYIQPDTGLSLKDVARLLNVTAKNGIVSLEDFDKAISSAKSPERRRFLMGEKETAISIGLFSNIRTAQNDTGAGLTSEGCPVKKPEDMTDDELRLAIAQKRERLQQEGPEKRRGINRAGTGITVAGKNAGDAGKRSSQQPTRKTDRGRER